MKRKAEKRELLKYGEKESGKRELSKYSEKESGKTWTFKEL